MEKLKTLFRGNISLRDLPREAFRRHEAAARLAKEKRECRKINELSARLSLGVDDLSSASLTGHFKNADRPKFWTPKSENETTEYGESPRFGIEVTIAAARRIVDDSTWELAGFGQLRFDGENAWRRDPLGETDWGTQHHSEITVYNPGGADIRVLWELNRFGHAISLALAYEETSDERFAETFFEHVQSWMQQNPYACGANWNCAMEAALRSINLLAAFDIFRLSEAFSDERALGILKLFDQHGRFILDNNEFSYIATSNHYLSDVVGLFWIGVMMPELENADTWKKFGLSEMLKEMDKQILADGADFEASTGYHRFITELFFYSFLLAKRNGIPIEDKYWAKLRSMFGYLSGIRRPDGRIPLVGDADGSQIIPIVRRDADEADYLLQMGVVFFDEPNFKWDDTAAPEIYWLFGNDGEVKFSEIEKCAARQSQAFPDAGAYVMRSEDLYLHFNANDCGIYGRGSHGHNDALSIEIAAFGRPFIVDPGSYVYNLDRDARHLFRSTAYHSTITFDGFDQNTTRRDIPFKMGNEAKPKVVEWRTSDERDLVSARHSGDERLGDGVIHSRSIEFQKKDGFWLVQDDFYCSENHTIEFRLHLAPGIAVEARPDLSIDAHDSVSGASLIITPPDERAELVFEEVFTSNNYGSKTPSVGICWRLNTHANQTARWLIVPVAAGIDRDERIKEVKRIAASEMTLSPPRPKT